jgi:hypothetical protein
MPGDHLQRLSPSAEQGSIAMQMRIIWGKILPGQWDAFEPPSRRRWKFAAK